MKVTLSLLSICLVACVRAAVSCAQERPPATPLITHDPYFSVWSSTNNLADSDTMHWTGSPQPIQGIVRVDNNSYRFMGRHPDYIPAMLQRARSITPTHTVYEFRQDGITLKRAFFTPAIHIDPIYRWTNEGSSRVPLTDWYDTKTGKQVGFQARSVVGGVFIKALANKKLAAKWQNKDISRRQ